jgi:hypothetical protein
MTFDISTSDPAEAGFRRFTPQLPTFFIIFVAYITGADLVLTA